MPLAWKVHQGQLVVGLFVYLSVRNSILLLLARRDECPESYCRTPGVGVGVGVRVYKNFNLAHNSWTTIGRAFIFHMCIPCDKTFPWYHFWPSDLDLEVWPTFKKL